MTVTDVIQFVDRMRPNAVPVRDKLRFLSDLDERIYTMIYDYRGDRPQAYTESDMTTNRPLWIPEEWRELYRWYLSAMVSVYAGNGEMYENDMVLFNDAWDRFAKWYIRVGRYQHGCTAH